jgi:prepilin-type N-terminal cleavage/methylation domain-containing protein
VLTMANRRGFTLAEIVIAMTLMLIVSGAAFKLLVTTQRLSRSQAEQASLQSNVRMGSLVVLNDLRELNTYVGGAADRNDILDAQVSDITDRAMRGMGFICQAPTATQIRIARNPPNGFSGYRDPQAGRDGLYVFIDGDPDSETDDIWLPVAIADVSTATACPGALGAGITLTVPNTAALVGPFAIPVGTPVHIYEVMELKLHQSDGKSWLGARSVSAVEVIQPVLGPLVDDNGFQLEYLDAGGAATANLTAIKSIRITIRGISDGAVNPGVEGILTHVQDSLVTQVALRNSFRP